MTFLPSSDHCSPSFRYPRVLSTTCTFYIRSRLHAYITIRLLHYRFPTDDCPLELVSAILYDTTVLGRYAAIYTAAAPLC